MDMQVETTKIPPDIAVVLVSGDMTFEETGAFGGTFGFATRALLARGAKKFILDLSGVERIDSVGGMTLVQCFFAARESDAGLCVACGSPSVTHLFETTQVCTLIPFFTTISAAAEHLRDVARARAGTT